MIEILERRIASLRADIAEIERITSERIKGDWFGSKRNRMLDKRVNLRIQAAGYERELAQARRA